jgi:lipopolysaccharide/colanic/teichoic acid biosynthesis glycosyltransferase
MTIFPFLIDRQPAYLQSNGASGSLLTTPVGTRSLLSHTCEEIAAITDEPVGVLTTFAAGREYGERLRDAGWHVSDVTELGRLPEITGRLELSDWLLLVDPRWSSVRGDGLRLLVRKLAEAQGARHLVALGASQQGTKEYVQFDADGKVQRIQRYYDGVTWLQTRAVAASLIPVSAVRIAPDTAYPDLTTLRGVLVACGAITHDIDLREGVFDLDQEAGLLQLCEQHLRHLPSSSFPPYKVLAPGVWVGPRCTIHGTARLCGPIILHEDVRVEADAKLIGPTVIGRGGRVGRGAVLARCLVAPEAVVPERAALHERVLCGDGGNGQPPTAYLAVASFPRCLQDQPRSLFGHARGRRRNKSRREAYVAIKCVIESVLALLGIIILSPLLLLTAAAIKLTSRGPVFFHHEREGKGGKPFRCCKYRTMVAGAHRQQRALYRQNALDGPQFKLQDDPRITWLGHWVRVTNLDELPQLFNVALGQMSLIGPRPSPFRENQICVPWREARLAVRPGITGLWQICRQDRSAGDFHQWIYYDMLYVRHLSPWLDLKILLATLLTLGGRRSVPLTWMIPARKLREQYERPTIAPAMPAPA